MDMLYKFDYDGYYNVVVLPKEIFDGIIEDYIIEPKDNPKIKYLLGNSMETDYLKRLGCYGDKMADYFQLKCEEL